MNEMIGINKIVKEYNGFTALDGLSFHMVQGEWMSVVGPSGSGKTTLINLTAGLDTPSSGWIVVGGKKISTMTQDQRAEFRRDTIGIVFQQFYLISYLTALENVMLAQYLHSIPEKEEALRSLEMTGVGDKADHIPPQLSGGEQQRVAIARALINDPSVLLADEPTGNLDAQNERIVLNIFKRLKSEGRTIMVVTHNLEVAKAGDRMIKIHHGRLE